MSPHEEKLYRVLFEKRNEPVSPTIQELMEATGRKSKSGVWQKLQSLEKCGYITIERRGQGSRNIITLTRRRPAGYGRVMEGWCQITGDERCHHIAIIPAVEGAEPPSGWQHVRLTIEEI